MTGAPGWLAPFSVMMTLVAALGGASGFGTLLLVRRQGRKITAETRKAGADTTQILTSAAVTLVAPLEQRLHAAEVQARLTRKRLRNLEIRLDSLVVAILDPQATLKSLRMLARRAQESEGGNGDG